MFNSLEKIAFLPYHFLSRWGIQSRTIRCSQSFYICSFFFGRGRGGRGRRETSVQTKPEPNKCKRTSKQREDVEWKFTYLPSLVALQYDNEQKTKIYGELSLGVHLSKYSSAAVNCLTLTLLVILVHSFQCQIILGHSLGQESNACNLYPRACLWRHQLP